jgi:hypothetical protein
LFKEAEETLAEIMRDWQRVEREQVALIWRAQVQGDAIEHRPERDTGRRASDDGGGMIRNARGRLRGAI